jgi:mRNA interferase RelE/StbE
VPYRITLVRSAEKYLDKLSKQQPADAEAIEDAIEALASTPRPPGCAALKGYRDLWRVRVRHYRICYQIMDDKLIILVLTVSTRDAVYEVLRRHLGHRH